MHRPFLRTALAVALANCFNANAAGTAVDDEAAVVVTATRVPYRDANAPYASEIHTRAMIESSGAQTLYDYLAQRSSVNIAPSFGDRFAPLIDMRGYGLETGYQNIVVSIDGQRLNNIDMSPQLIGAIPLNAIDHIEITKGSGSVVQGDGAMAGSIQIYTRPTTGVSVGSYVGSQGSLGANVAAGTQGDNYALSLSADHSRFGGYSESDVTGSKDASEMRNERAKLGFRPLQSLWLNLDASDTYIDTRYPNPLTLAQFNADPAQSGGPDPYTRQLFRTGQWRLGGELEIDERSKATLSYNQEDKRSDFFWHGGPSSTMNYRYNTTDLAFVRAGEALDVTTGLQVFDGTRFDATDQTKKNNRALYAQLAYRLGETTLSAGARRETVEYEYVPSAGASLSQSNSLHAWDLGLNQRLNPNYSLFANLNKSFQAPDIDRFFLFGGAFNAFIQPATAKTLTVGLNRTAPGNRFKIDVFRANLNDEIYYNPLTWANTNIDKSHKYGLEVQEFWKATQALSFNANYAYVRAIIDSTAQGGGAFDGRELPGVPHHSLGLSGTYRFSGNSDVTLSQNWKSSSYAIGDFANNGSQRQAAYNVTNLAYRYRTSHVEYFATVQNLLNHHNGIWVGDDNIYPVDFARTILVGIKASIQ